MKRLVLALLLGVICSAQALDLQQPVPKIPVGEYKGSVVFVNFWASWCAPCQTELPELDRLAKHYKGKKVKVVTINVDTDRDAARKLLQKLQLNPSRFIVKWDSDSKIVKTYDIEGMPSSFIIDTQGIVRYKQVGFRSSDPQKWRAQIDSLLVKK